MRYILASAEHVGVKPDSRKRSGSSGKTISLQLVYKSGGLEQKVILSPCTSHHQKKPAVEWLKSLKKVRVPCLPAS